MDLLALRLTRSCVACGKSVAIPRLFEPATCTCGAQAEFDFEDIDTLKWGHGRTFGTMGVGGQEQFHAEMRRATCAACNAPLPDVTMDALAGGEIACACGAKTAARPLPPGHAVGDVEGVSHILGEGPGTPWIYLYRDLSAGPTAAETARAAAADRDRALTDLEPKLVLGGGGVFVVGLVAAAIAYFTDHLGATKVAAVVAGVGLAAAWMGVQIATRKKR